MIVFSQKQKPAFAVPDHFLGRSLEEIPCLSAWSLLLDWTALAETHTDTVTVLPCTVVQALHLTHI